MVSFDQNRSRYIRNLIDPEENLPRDMSMNSSSGDILVGGIEVTQTDWKAAPDIEEVDFEVISRPIGWDNVRVGNIVILYRESMFSHSEEHTTNCIPKLYNRIPYRVVEFEEDTSELEYKIIVSPINGEQNIRICFDNYTGTHKVESSVFKKLFNKNGSTKIEEFPAGPCLVSDKVVSEWVEYDSKLVSFLI